MNNFYGVSLYNKYLPYFNKRYTFEICPSYRVNDLEHFIDNYWKKGHILSSSRNFLNWQHYNKLNDCYNFVIAVEKKTNEIHAINGFTLSTHFDPDIKTPVYWGNIWKKRSDIEEPGLGMMVNWLTYDIFNICHIGFGLSNDAIRITKKYKLCTYIAEQFYILHPYKNEFHIASIKSYTKHNSNRLVDTNKSFTICTEDTYKIYCKSLYNFIPPYKSINYYINRFFNHPLYKYEAFCIKNANENILGIMFYRICYYKSYRCIRIVDYFGINGAIAGCYMNFVKILEYYDAEYIDFICTGMNKSELEEAGFLDLKNEHDNIIPNYFEPFIQKNVDLHYEIANGNKKFKINIFKGDSDQDRPNSVITECVCI